jgi:hypothetical protein
VIQKKSLLSYGLIFLFLFSFIIRLLPGPRTIDDAYITFRYAHNLLAGYGFVFNLNEKVLGTTTPLYTLVLSTIGWFWHQLSPKTAVPFPEIAWVTNAILDSVTCVLLAIIGKKFQILRVGFLTGLVWAIAPYSVTFSIGGMETSLYITLICMTFWVFLNNWSGLTGFLAGLCLLTRPDALIFLLPLGVQYFFKLFSINELQKNKQILRLIGSFCIPTFLWFGFAYLYFGSPIPQSILAKTEAYRLDPSSTLIRFLQHFLTPFMDQNWSGSTGIMIGLFLYPFLFLVGAYHLVKTKISTLSWVLFPWLYLIIFSIPNPLVFRWYLTPPLPAWFFCILCGFDQILSNLSNYISKRFPSYSYVNIIFTLLLFYPFVSTLTEWKINPEHGPNRPAPDMAYIELETQYLNAAQIINQKMIGQDYLLAAGDVGVLGYYTKADILDTVGLNSPIATTYFPLDPSSYVINYAIPSELIIDQSPDVVVFLEVYGRKTLLVDPQFNDQFSLFEKIPSNMYGSDGLLIYQSNRFKK